LAIAAVADSARLSKLRGLMNCIGAGILRAEKWGAEHQHGSHSGREMRY
jgi:hypothetical protein